MIYSHDGSFKNSENIEKEALSVRKDLWVFDQYPVSFQDAALALLRFWSNH
jgi:hypothetical protein